MAESGLWGTPVGRIAAGQEMLDSAQGLSRIDLEAAHGRYYGAGAQKLEADAAEQQQMAELARRAAGGPQGGASVSMADRMDALAETAMNSGLVTRAQVLSKDASLVRQRESAADSSQTTAVLNRLKGVREQAELTGQLFGGATDEASWQRAGELFEFQTGQRNPYAGVPWTADLSERINSAALSTKERLDLEETRVTHAAQERHRVGRRAQHDQALRISEARLALERARQARLEKIGGGKAVSAPATTEITQAKRLVARDYEGMEATDLNDAAYAVAAEARALRRANPALDANVALQQAYNNARAAGDFQLTRRGIDIPLLGNFGSKAGYRGAGKTFETAVPVPKDNTLLQSGRFYSSPSGVVGKWNGKAFEIVPRGARPLQSGNGSLADPEDEDEE